MDRDNALRKIQKLMKTADSNATDGEIRNALRMAADLMAKWDIEDADLQTDERAQSVKVVEVTGPDRAGSLEIIDRNLLVPVSTLCDVKVIFRTSHKTGKKREAPVFIGLERDAHAAVTMYQELRLMMRAMARHRVDSRDGAGKKWTKDHVDYCKGFASTVASRAWEIKDASRNAVGPNCTAIVLRKTEVVDNYMDRTYGNLKARRSNGRGQTYNNVAAFLIGKGDGQHVDLGPKRAAGDRALGETKKLPPGQG